MERDDLASIVEQLNAEPQVGLTLDQVVQQAVTNVPNCDMCSAFIRRGPDVIEQAAATDSLAQRLDELQFALGEGPCLDVLWDREILRVEDTATESRWPRWTAEAHALDVRSSLSVRLPVNGQLNASLNMYALEPDTFDDETVDMAIIYARLATVAVQNACASDGLRSALHGRLIIGVAQGIIMQEYGISLDRAFEVLRRRSNETNTKLRDLAVEIVQATDPTALGAPKHAEEPGNPVLGVGQRPAG